MQLFSVLNEACFKSKSNKKFDNAIFNGAMWESLASCTVESVKKILVLVITGISTTTKLGIY